MIVLSCNNIYKSYLVDNVLDNISFSINKNEKVGLVGLNGAGKSTLFNIITGDISPDSGDIMIPKDHNVGILRQQTAVNSENTIYDELLSVFSHLIDMESELRTLEKKISTEGQNGESKKLDDLMNKYARLSELFEEQNGYGYKSDIRGVLAGLGFSESFFDRGISELSGGQKARISLGKILLEKPEILLLDEPTNHLDISAINWLEKYIKEYDGTIILISHDRYFLDNTVSRIMLLENSKLSSYDGNYTTFMKKRKADLEIRRRHYENQQKEIKKQKELIDKFMSHGRERSVKLAKSRQKLLDKMEKVDAPDEEKSKTKIQFTPAVQSGNDVLDVSDLSISFDEDTIFSDLNLKIYKGDHIGLIGPNGIGKTSLFKAIQGIIPPSSGNVSVGHNVHIAYFDQEQSNLDPDKTVLDEIWDEYPDLNHSRVRALLGRFLFFGDDIFAEVSTLSGGEKSRLSLLKLMLSKSNFLLMDEPTNHLDLDSKEVLEDAIRDYNGTVLVISHDRYFLNKIADKIVEMSPYNLKEYLGNYDYYLEKKATENMKEEESNTQKTKTEVKAIRKKEKESQREQKNLRNKIKKLESEIAERENLIEELEAKLCEPEIFSDHEKSEEINSKLEDNKSKLESLYEEWIVLTEN